jgi:hypothetical protein
MKQFTLSIPQPCHENWEAMTLQEKGRFCGACQKTVVDFSTMSDRQLAEFFKKPTGSVCGRFSKEQLGREIETPRKRLPWIKHFFTIALPAFLWSVKGNAQGEVKLGRRLGEVSVCKNEPDTVIKPTAQPAEQRIIEGRVVDENGAGIVSATVMFKGTQVVTSANEEGYFKLVGTNLKAKEIVISSVGFRSVTVSLTDSSYQRVLMQRLEMELMGELVIVAKPKAKNIPLVKSPKRDAALSRFSVYPNPATAGTAMSIGIHQLEKGTYDLTILSGNGKVVQRQAAIVEETKTPWVLKLAAIPAGPYFLRLTNRKTNTSYTEIIIVQ